MAEHQEKAPAQKSKHDVPKSSNDHADSGGSVQFEDNRHDNIAQLQAMANDSPEVNKTAQLQSMANEFLSAQSNPIQKQMNANVHNGTQVIQRITYKEAFDQLPFPIRFEINDWLSDVTFSDLMEKWNEFLAPKSYKQVFEEISAWELQNYFDRNDAIQREWIEARAGKKKIDQYLFLKDTPKAVIRAKIEEYKKFKQGEKYDDGPVPGKETDALLRDDKTIGGYIAQRLHEGAKVDGNILILGDAAFQAAHLADSIALNAGTIGGLAPEKREGYIENLRIVNAKKVDGVQGFTRSNDHKIILRKGLATPRVIVHEAVHLFSSHAFENEFGHPFNEGTTDMLSLKAYETFDKQPDLTIYPNERRLVVQIMQDLKITMPELMNAYFLGNIGSIRAKFIQRIGILHFNVFKKEKPAGNAFKIYNAAIKAMAQQ